MKILVADDDPSIVRSLMGFLNRHGHEVDTVEDGHLVFARLESGRKYDLIITDYIMDQMWGDSVLKRIRADERWKKIPVIVFSGHHDIRKTVEKFGGTFVEKTDPRGLINVIAKLTVSS